MRGLAREVGISEGLMSHVMKDDLNMGSYARPWRHLISSGAKVRRLDRAKKLLNRLKHEDAGKTGIFRVKSGSPLSHIQTGGMTSLYGAKVSWTLHQTNCAMSDGASERLRPCSLVL